MRLLLLGGTWFLGRSVAELALRAGWSVTTFNRGTSPDVVGVETVRGDRERSDDWHRLAAHGPWDAVIDTIGYVPAQVLAAATALEPKIGRYVFVSSVNVYTGWPDQPLDEGCPVFECPPDADADFGADLGYAGQYGALKAGCEQAVRTSVGDERTAVLRPGVILGPHEYVGRLTWWLARAARGGTVLAPAPRQRPIQPVDVRDVAAFALHCAANAVAGVFNVTAPSTHATFGELVEECVRVTAGGGVPAWVDPAWLIDQGVSQWTELPLWRTNAGVWAVDSARAQAAGLRCRPLSATVNETWTWMTGGGQAIAEESGEAARAADHGMTPQREHELLAAWKHVASGRR